jgi:hypothetical protein
MIIWLSSYPKSGNTWVRLFLKKYFGINYNYYLNKSFPITEQLTKLNVDYRKFDEIAKNWELHQKFINQNNQTNYLKTHSAFHSYKNYKFTTKLNTKGVIYIVRDPRDVIISYAHHMNKSIKETLGSMLKNDSFEVQPYKGPYKQSDKEKFRKTLMGSWADHFNSWKSYNQEQEILIIKYENLINDTKNEFLKILNYLKKIDKIEINKLKLKLAIEETSFNKLSNEEKQRGFDEAMPGTKFFRKGLVGDWKKNLDKETKEIIEKKFEKEMPELGYL